MKNKFLIGIAFLIQGSMVAIGGNQGGGFVDQINAYKTLLADLDGYIGDVETALESQQSPSKKSSVVKAFNNADNAFNKVLEKLDEINSNYQKLTRVSAAVKGPIDAAITKEVGLPLPKWVGQEKTTYREYKEDFEELRNEGIEAGFDKVADLKQKLKKAGRMVGQEKKENASMGQINQRLMSDYAELLQKSRKALADRKTDNDELRDIIQRQNKEIEDLMNMQRTLREIIQKLEN